MVSQLIKVRDIILHCKYTLICTVLINVLHKNSEPSLINVSF